MIKPIVEGHGEVAALPVLLRRVAGECFGIWNVPLLRPGRYPATRLLRRENGVWTPGPDFAKAGQHALNEGATCILAVLDLDDGCPKVVYESLVASLGAATGLSPSCLVLAKCEYEAWFLASCESLKDGIGPYPEDPEIVRDAKGALERHLQLEFPYVETTDQPGYSSRIDLKAAYRRSRSFRKLVKDFRHLLTRLGFQPAPCAPVE
jgi:hypothetical protein